MGKNSIANVSPAGLRALRADGVIDDRETKDLVQALSGRVSRTSMENVADLLNSGAPNHPHSHLSISAQNHAMLSEAFLSNPHSGGIRLRKPRPENLRGGDLRNAPDGLAVEGGRAVFIDISKSTVDLSINIDARTAMARVRIEFEQLEEGFPILDLTPQVMEIAVDGQKLEVEQFATVTLSTMERALRFVRAKLKPGRHTIEVRYPMPGVTFSKGSVDFELRMSDQKSRHHQGGYLEHFFPSNYLFDQHPIQIRLELYGMTKKTPGDEQRRGENYRRYFL